LVINAFWQEFYMKKLMKKFAKMFSNKHVQPLAPMYDEGFYDTPSYLRAKK